MVFHRLSPRENALNYELDKYFVIGDVGVCEAGIIKGLHQPFKIIRV